MEKKKIAAYHGTAHYIFVSYAHRDERDVYPAIEALTERGYHVWYDEGISAGEDWAMSIADALEKARAVIFFASGSSVKSRNCQREVTYALERGIPVLTVSLGKVSLPEELKRQLQVYQMLELSGMHTYDEFVRAIEPALYNAGLISEAWNPANNPLIRISGRRRRRIAILCVVGAVILALLGNRFLFGFVPNVLGLEPEEAQSRVEDADFKCSTGMDYSDDMEYGYIFLQNVTGKTLLFRTVQLTQSLGPNRNLADVPQTEGFHIADGVVSMVDAGFCRLLIDPTRTNECAVAYIANQSIPAGLRVSTENQITLQVASDGNDIVFTYHGKTITIPGDKKCLITVDANGDLSVELVYTFTMDVNENRHYWINNAQTLFLDMRTLSLTELEQVEQTGIYRGTIHATFDISSTKKDLPWKILTGLLGDQSGKISTELTIDPLYLDMKAYDEGEYRAFVAGCDRSGKGPKTYRDPVCMCLANSVTLTQESRSTEVLAALTTVADLFSDRLPVIKGDQLYVDYSIVVMADGTVDLTFYGDSMWAIQGTAEAK